MHSELLALADNGEIYTWSWEKDAKPSKHAHPAISKFYNGLINLFEIITKIGFKMEPRNALLKWSQAVYELWS